jgi:hypothetical protein
VSSLSVSIGARLNRGALDRALADGADPAGSPQLAWRSRELALPRTRRQLARVLTHVLDAAAEPPSWWRGRGVQPPVRSAAVLDAAPEIRALTDRLQAPQPAAAQGLALTSLLAWDTASPLFAAAEPGAVAAWVCTARQLLD